MADEPDNENTETPEDAAAPVEPQAAAPEVSEGEVAAATEAAEEPAASEPAEGETAEESAPEAHAPAEPVEEGTSKERRRRKRSAHAGEARPSRTPEERHAERVEERRKKAVRRRTRRLGERAKAAERRAAAPPAEPLAPVHAAVQGTRRVRQGVVVSNKSEKTITVRIDVARRHRRYEKIVRSSSTLHAHDENNDAHEGDVVRVIESRPLSKTKRWVLVDVLERAR
jgi:small subunit ribosomal protein S17